MPFRGSHNDDGRSWGYGTPNERRRTRRIIYTIAALAGGCWVYNNVDAPDVSAPSFSCGCSDFSSSSDDEERRTQGYRWSVGNIGGAEFGVKHDERTGEPTHVIDVPDDVNERDIDGYGRGQRRVRVEDPKAVTTVHDITSGRGRVVSQKKGSPIRVTGHR